MSVDLKPFEEFTKQHGLAYPSVQSRNGQGALGKGEKPRLVLPSGQLPSEYVSILNAAECIFPILARSGKYFSRGRIPFELVRDIHGEETLLPLRPSPFRTRLEEHFDLWAWRLHKEQPTLRRTTCAKETAEAILESNPAIDLLPSIRLLVKSPVLTHKEGHLLVCSKGYNSAQEGIYVLKGTDIPEVSLTDAVDELLNLLVDYDFVSNSDKSRAIAGFISPALRFGKLLDCDFPLDLAEADASQSGKTLRQKMVCAIYGEQPYIITRKDGGGVGSLDESVSSALVSARPFITLENFRGVMNSQIIESALRGHGVVNCRIPYKGEVQIRTDHVCWQLSSNNAETTRDLANRSIITRIRKRPVSYKFKTYPEGDVIRHIRKNQSRYLGCVFAVVRQWFDSGKPVTDDYRHDFREWCGALDWIIKNIFCLPPLLDDHRDEQLRISSPDRTWLRQVALAIQKDNRLDDGLKPAEIADVCEAHGLDIPGCRPGIPTDQISMQTGKVLKRIFSEEPSIEVGGFQISREAHQEYNSTRRETIAVHYHKFSVPQTEKCPPCTPCPPKE